MFFRQSLSLIKAITHNGISCTPAATHTDLCYIKFCAMFICQKPTINK